MGKEQLPPVQYLHEAAFSINLALALVAFVFLFDPRPVTSALFRMNEAVYVHLGFFPANVRVWKDHYTEGYFAFFVPAVVLAVSLWVLLRRGSRLELIGESLRSLAGFTGIAAPPAWLLCSTYLAERRDGWSPFTAISFYEVVLVLVLTASYLSRQWPNSEWAAIVILVLHYGFWLWQFGPRPFFMGYGGPLAPSAGLCAGLAWIFYLRQVRRARKVA